MPHLENYSRFPNITRRSFAESGRRRSENNSDGTKSVFSLPQAGCGPGVSPWLWDPRLRCQPSTGGCSVTSITLTGFQIPCYFSNFLKDKLSDFSCFKLVYLWFVFITALLQPLQTNI